LCVSKRKNSSLNKKGMIFRKNYTVKKQKAKDRRLKDLERKEISKANLLMNNAEKNKIKKYYLYCGR
jgi:hypothetical protein